MEKSRDRDLELPPVIATSDADEAVDESLAGLSAEQQAEAQAYAMEFLKKIIRLKGVKIDREVFLRQELRKWGLSDEVIASVIQSTRIQAGLSIEELDALGSATIEFETRKSAAMSFAAGIPGGLAMFATVPGDITQYYVHAFRIMQKLAYLYGWQDFLGDLDDADDETVGKLAVFLGVMMGVGGASASLTRFAQQVARPAIQKQITNTALTKTVWYPVVKQTLKLVGVKVTKDSFAKTVTKVVPLAGGVISGGMTLVSLKSQSVRLQKHLRELPPPGVDAAEYLAALRVTAFDDDAESLGDKAKGLLGNAASVASAGAASAAGAAAEGAKKAAGGAATRLRGIAGGWRKSDRDADAEV